MIKARASSPPETRWLNGPGIPIFRFSDVVLSSHPQGVMEVVNLASPKCRTLLDVGDAETAALMSFWSTLRGTCGSWKIMDFS